LSFAPLFVTINNELGSIDGLTFQQRRMFQNDHTNKGSTRSRDMA